MILIGALLATCAGTAAVLASRPPSMIRRRLAQLSPRPVAESRIRSFLITHELSRSGLGWSEIDLLRAKVVAALVAAAAVAVVGLAIPIGAAFAIAAAYAGFVAPTVYVERAASRCRADAERALVALVEWTEALVASGRPVETALVAVAELGVGSVLVDAALATASRSYALGAPLFRALGREGSAVGLTTLARFAVELERTRDLGRGALTVLRDERERLRASERARTLDAAGHVEGRLMLVLVLCYLPALMMLVVIPLFLGLLDGLFV